MDLAAGEAQEPLQEGDAGAPGAPSLPILIVTVIPLWLAPQLSQISLSVEYAGCPRSGPPFSSKLRPLHGEATLPAEGLPWVLWARLSSSQEDFRTANCSEVASAAH